MKFQRGNRRQREVLQLLRVGVRAENQRFAQSNMDKSVCTQQEDVCLCGERSSMAILIVIASSLAHGLLGSTLVSRSDGNLFEVEMMTKDVIVAGL